MADVTAVHAMVGISKLAQMTGATARALRHSEDAGLVRPHRTATGVRQFTPGQCDQGALIVRLRRCGLPLDIIQHLLTEAGPLAERQTRLHAEFRERADALVRRLDLITTPMAEAA